MAYGESNVTCPMTSRDAKWWSRLSHIFVINSRLTIACYNRHVITEILKNEVKYRINSKKKNKKPSFRYDSRSYTASHHI